MVTKTARNLSHSASANATASPDLLHLHKTLRRVIQLVIAPGETRLPLLDVPPSQFICLRYVLENDSCKLVDVARARNLSLPNASRIVDRLVRRDLVLRERDTHDRRVVRLCATDEARFIVERLDAARLERLGRTTAMLDNAQLESIAGSLELLIAAAEKAALNVVSNDFEVKGRV